MSSTYFPLRWESTGDQWWYASPIDWAAANGHYDLVRELLHLDTNLLIKLTSLRRIRRLETVWDDEAQFNEAAKCRSQVAKNLLMECETNMRGGLNSLIRAGYGGWLLYTAASAGDLGFVNELLERDPSLVFGEGEYGVTDILYAAARGKNSQVFRLLLQFSVSRCLDGGEIEEGKKSEESCTVFRSEMMNRALHAAARGGNVEMLKEILGDCSDILVYRDAEGSTLLHTASGRGQVEVVKDLLASYDDIITSKDNRGNTALNVAAYRGNLAVVEVLILASPSVASLTNTNGDTFLHMAVAGFRSPGFRRLDRQIELMKQLVCGKLVNIEDTINIRNGDGRTALHMAVSENIQSDVVELLMSVPLINLNICDDNGMTPLDLLKQRPKSASSEILIKRLISAGGIFSCRDEAARSALASHLKMQGIGGSPGTSFGVSDAEIFLYAGIEDTSEPAVGREYGYFSGEISNFNSPSMDSKKLSSVNSAAKRLKILLRWPRKGKKDDSESLKSYNTYEDSFENSPISLRQKFTKQGSLPNNKRIHAIRNGVPSPSAKKKFSARLMHGVIQAVPQLDTSPSSPSSRFSQSSRSSPISTADMQKGTTNEIEEDSGGKFRVRRQKTFSPINKKLMNRYFCFGAQGLAADDSASGKQPRQSYRRSTSLMT